MAFENMTLRQLEEAEDYLGVGLDRANDASPMRLTVVGAWGKALESDPSVTLDSMRDKSLADLQKYLAVDGQGEA